MRHLEDDAAGGPGAWALAGLLVVVATLAALVTWAAVAPLSGAVVAPGSVFAESFSKRVQHPDGGIVAALLVMDGDEVEEGALLLRLDDVAARANLGIVLARLDKALARRARLDAERDGAAILSAPEALAQRLDRPDARDALAGERALFEARRTNLETRRRLLRERRAQAVEEARGLSDLHAARGREVAILRQEVAATESLVRQAYAPLLRLLAQRRELVDREGVTAQLAAAAAQAGARVSEADIALLQADEDFTAGVLRDLRETEALLVELEERRTANAEVLRRTEIRSPRRGTVHDVQVHTVGAVIRPGETVMTVVPRDDDLVVEARVAPTDIDQVTRGMPAAVRFTTFNRRVTPELNGLVQRVGADVVADPVTQLPFYPVRVLVPREELSRLGDAPLIPGMPAQVFVQTGERTLLSYLLKPISDQFARAFRER
jgi:HlyD family secretion protein